MRTFFTQVLAERDGLDATAVKEDTVRLKGEGGLTDTRFGMESNPIVSIARYHARLERLAVNTFAAAQQPYQFALEAAIEDLTAGKGAKRLADVEKRLASAIDADGDGNRPAPPSRSTRPSTRKRATRTYCGRSTASSKAAPRCGGPSS